MFSETDSETFSIHFFFETGSETSLVPNSFFSLFTKFIFVTVAWVTWAQCQGHDGLGHAAESAASLKFGVRGTFKLLVPNFKDTVGWDGMG